MRPVLRKQLFLGLSALLTVSLHLKADEGGSSFWLPGQYGSFAALPGDPGWSLGLLYYHSSADADRTEVFPKGNAVTLGLDVGLDLGFIAPTYIFSDPLWGGQASVTLAALYGRVEVDTDFVLSTGRSRERSDAVTALGDFYPTASVRWNEGKHNYMLYTMLGVPIGQYDAQRLASIGSNHWAADLGGAYTYFDQENGYEFSVTAGLTYNFENPDTQYRSGIDGHIDWGASYFLSETFNIGLNGYFFYQLTGDSGEGAVLGDFKSKVNGIGPQINYFFPINDKQGLLSLKGYWESGAKHRVEGSNVWLIVSFPL